MVFAELYDVYVAEGPQYGLRLVASKRPDLVFCDIRMPGMSGLEVLRRIKETYPETEVVMITAFAGLDLAQEALRGGATDYLLKPFGLEEVRGIAEQAVQRVREHRARQGRDSQLEYATHELAARLQEVAGPPPDTQVPQVMVADDDEFLLEAIEAYLTSAGLRVQAFSRGRAALSQLGRYLREKGVAPDVLVTDLRLPDLLGFHLARRVREWAPDTWIILLTSEHVEVDQAPFLDVVLPKPFRLPVLLDNIQARLAAQAAGEPPSDGSSPR